ncbi:MAG: DGQHR domain-containing protein [Pseudomonadota bacterium]
MLNFKLGLKEPFENGSVELKCVKVKQPIGVFFIGSMSKNDLVRVTYSDVRRIESEREFETYLGIQRPLKNNRVQEIKEYVETSDACFPTAVILSVDEKCAEYDEDTMTLRLTSFKSEDEDDESISLGKIAKVIDGQHRIEGLRQSDRETFDMNVAIFVDIDVASEAYIFSTVNIAQTKIGKSLLYDLYDLAEKRSPQKLCHNIAVALNSISGSPFENRIKRLGVAGPKTEATSITQAAFVTSLMKFISKEPLKDRDLYLRNKKPEPYSGRKAKTYIFRDLMIQEKDYELTDIIWNYFSAVSKRWPEAWANDDKGVMIRKTNGFMAFMRFLRDVYTVLDETVPSEKTFLEIMNRVELDDRDFVTDHYKPGSSGEAALYHDLKGFL